MPTALRNGLSRGQSGKHMLALSFSGFDRCCRKSRKSNDAKNLANVDFWTTPPLRCSLVSIRRSVVVFLRSDVRDHIDSSKSTTDLGSGAESDAAAEKSEDQLSRDF